MKPLVIGLGNRDRGDDAVGLVVADLLADRGDHDVVAWEGSELDLLDLWRGRPDVVLVDAVVSGRMPGTVQELDATSLEAVASSIAGSSHGFDLVWVVKLARRLGALPERLRIVAVEAADLGHGAGLSAPVELASGEVVEQLSAWSRNPVVDVAVRPATVHGA